LGTIIIYIAIIYIPLQEHNRVHDLYDYYHNIREARMKLNCVILPLCPFCVISIPLALVGFIFLWILAKLKVGWAEKAFDWSKHRLLHFWQFIKTGKISCQDYEKEE